MPTWVITGSNRGLGLEFVSQLSTDPSNTIIALTRSTSRPLPDLETHKAKSKNIHTLECDTGSQESISSLASKISDFIGKDGKIDYLLNNAAINANSSQTALSLTPEALNSHMNINVLGPALIVQTLSPFLQSGSVVMNMTSGLGSLSFNRSRPSTECTVYAISKAALNMLTVHQAAEMKGRGVVVVCVDPGWVKTDMGGKGAQMEKEESIGGMLKVLRGLGKGDEGRFLLFDGTERGW